MLIKSSRGVRIRCLLFLFGNSFADEHAKTALHHHPSWSQNEIEHAKDLLSMFEEFIEHVARTLAAFVVHPKHTKCFEVDGIRNKKPPRKKRARLIGPSHTWYWAGGSKLWRCMSCLKSGGQFE